MKFIVALFMLALPNAVQAKWLEATSQSFIVYSEGSEAALRKFTERLERFDSVLRLTTNVDAEPSGMKLKVYLLSSERAVRDIYPGDAKRIAGFYTTTLHGPVAFVPQVKKGGIFDLDGAQVLYHEYAHHFMQQYTRSAYPAWYVEGFAEYFSSVDFREKENVIHVGKPVNNRLPALFLESWLPLEKLMSLTYLRKEKPTDREMNQLYAQGWLLTHYLFSAKDRKGQIGDYVRNLNKGMVEKDAFQAAFKADHATLYKELKRYFNQDKIPYSKLNILNAEPIAITVRALVPAEDATLIPIAKIRLFVPKLERAAFTASFFKAITPHLQTNAGRLAQAEWEVRFGDVTKVSALVSPVLAQNPAEPQALLLEAMVAGNALQTASANQRDAAIKKFRQSAIKANRAATETPLPLLFYFQSYAMADGEMPDQAINGLMKAWELLPQDVGLTFTMASALAAKKRFDEAKYLLQPLIYSPHGASSAEVARKMLDRIETGQDIGISLPPITREASESD